MATSAPPYDSSRSRTQIHVSPSLSVALVACALACSCSKGTKTASGETPTPTQAVTPSVPTTRPTRGERRTIETGELLAGTHPGQFDWQPELEPLPFRIKLGEFEVDVLPYPNDPTVPRKTTASVDEAAQWCAQAGGRLCTELEWERACRGPEQHPFAGGTSHCAAGNSCTSGFGVVGLGAEPEWTASRFGATSTLHGQPVLRGKPTASTDPLDERCSNRHAPAREGGEAAVRCCYGAPNAARVEEPQEHPVFERPSLAPARLKKLLDADQRTAGLSKDLVLFADPEATNTVISRGPGDRKGFDFSTGPLLWSPTLGARFLVLGGKSGKDTTFVLTYHVLPDDEYVLASSYIMENEVGPVTFAYSDSIRPRLHFSTCWGCPGETGKILFRKPGRVTILQP